MKLPLGFVNVNRAKLEKVPYLGLFLSYKGNRGFERKSLTSGSIFLGLEGVGFSFLKVKDRRQIFKKEAN